MSIAAVKENIGAIAVLAFLMLAYGLWFWGQYGATDRDYFMATIISSEQSRTGGFRGYLPSFTARANIGDNKVITIGSLKMLKVNSVVCVEAVKNESGRELQYNATEASLCNS